MGTDGELKSPRSLVVTVRRKPVLVLAIVTDEFGSIAPVWSDTDPRTLPVATWALQGAMDRIKRKAVQSFLFTPTSGVSQHTRRCIARLTKIVVLSTGIGVNGHVSLVCDVI